MQLHQLNPVRDSENRENTQNKGISNGVKSKHKLKKKKRIGRGGKRGTYSGKGIKGQKSRAGRKFAPVIRELIKRYPKLRGYRFKKHEGNLVIVNVGILEERFRSSEIITPKLLLERKIIRKIKGKVPKVKILGRGELTKKLTIENCEVSKSAEEKIKKAGGTIEADRSASRGYQRGRTRK